MNFECLRQLIDCKVRLRIGPALYLVVSNLSWGHFFHTTLRLETQLSRILKYHSSRASPCLAPVHASQLANLHWEQSGYIFDLLWVSLAD